MFTASLDQVGDTDGIRIIHNCLHISGVSRIQPDKRGTATGRFIHQPAYLSGGRCHGVDSLCWLPVRNHLSLLPPIPSQRGCSHRGQLASNQHRRSFKHRHCALSVNGWTHVGLWSRRYDPPLLLNEHLPIQRPGEVKLWDTPSAQCVRSLPHKGTVVTVQFMPTPPSLIDRWICLL